MSNVKCACKDCTERYVGCHSTCEKYADFKKRNQIVHERELDYSRNNSDHIAHEYRAAKNFKNYHRDLTKSYIVQK